MLIEMFTKTPKAADVDLVLSSGSVSDVRRKVDYQSNVFVRAYLSVRGTLHQVRIFSDKNVWTSLLPMLGLTTIAIDGNALGRVIEDAITHRGVVLSTYVLCLLDPSPA
jgi:hypothetical protein